MRAPLPFWRSGVLPVLTVLVSGYSGLAMADPITVKIEQQWSGSLPVESLKLFPENQQKSRVAYVADQKQWETLWNVFESAGEQSDAELPKVDFEKSLVVVTKNVRYLNRISVNSASLDNGVLRVLALETRSARPIENKVYCAILVVPRKGIEKISDGGRQTIEIKPDPALTGAVKVDAREASFENVTAWIRLWEYDPRLVDVSADLFGDVKLAKLKHETGTATTMEFEVGDAAKINPERQYYVTVFLYRDGKVGDNKSEVFFLDGFNKVKLPGKVDGTLRKQNR